MPVTLGQGRAVSRAAARGVPTMEAFGQIMPQVVEAAAQQYLRHAQVHPPAGPQGRERPRLLGPMGDSGGYTLPHIVTSDDTGVNNGTDDDRAGPPRRHPDRGSREQTRTAGVAYVGAVGRGLTPKAGGRVLDGRTWDEYPTMVPAGVAGA